ncbi:MAG: choice-of-anchor J domain-containing protein [Muribaculaceae bacterium]|nr:choice-of-anchor J domain-containing protein [Muribaculaceae bacterium]
MSIGSTSINVNRVFGDLNEDGEVNIVDLNLLVNLILKGGSGQEADQYVPNMTIAEFKAKHWQDAASYIDTVTDNEIIHGWVTSSDESGNIYKSLYIVDESGAGIAISINKTNLYQDYPIGQEIVLPMQGYFVGKYMGMQQIGYPSWYANGNTWEVSFIPLEMWESMVKPKGTPDPDKTEPSVVSLDEFANNFDPETLQSYQGKLVRINNVKFEIADGVNTFSETSHATSRVITDEYGNQIYVRTSNYADFASNPLPVGSVDLVGELSFYSRYWQLLLRSADDVIPGEGEGEAPTPVTSLDESFDYSLPINWTRIAISGDRNWYHTMYQQNGYAAMTGHTGKQPPFDAWLITPAIDIKNAVNKVLTFTTQFAAYNSSTTVFEVYVLDSADPETATVKVKLNPVLASPSSTSIYSEVTESGDIDLSQWADGVYHIGFRYYATNDVDYGTWCLDNVKFGLSR